MLSSNASFNRPVDVATLGLFRLVWGALLIAEAIARFKHVDGVYSPTYAHFRYFGFHWVPVPSDTFLIVEICILTVLGLLIFLGVFFRSASVGYGLIYLHLFLIDEVYYNNHFYLTVLMCMLMACTAADKAFSLWSFRNRDKDSCAPAIAVPVWQYWLIRGQILVVYVFGGVAKLNADWLRAQPLKYWFSLSNSIKFPMNYLAGKDWFAWMASYGGLFIDLVCPFLLLFRRTRWFAVAVFISFHVMNSRLFKIGFFPWLAIGMLIPFFAPPAARKLWGTLQNLIAGVRRIRMPDLTKALPPSRIPQKAILVLFCIYFVIQVSLPFRHFLYGQRPDWTECGQKFSWRMMLRNKDSYIQFVFDPPEAETWINQNPKLRPQILGEHVERMSDHPWHLLQYTRLLDNALAENGFPDTKISAILVSSLNDRPYRVMIDPSIDLTEVEYTITKVPDWIVPLDPTITQTTMPLTSKDRLAAIKVGLEDYFAEFPEKRFPVPTLGIR